MKPITDSATKRTSLSLGIEIPVSSINPSSNKPGEILSQNPNGSFSTTQEQLAERSLFGFGN
jgi:hypothetical protein